MDSHAHKIREPKEGGCLSHMLKEKSDMNHLPINVYIVCGRATNFFFRSLLTLLALSVRSTYQNYHPCLNANPCRFENLNGVQNHNYKTVAN